MRTITALLCLLLLPSARAEPWRLVWSDEFEYQGLPDPKKWDYEVGYERNNELQYYTRGRPENARVENGMLVIEARKEAYPIPANPRARDPAARGPRQAGYTSASLITLNRASWTYGRMEMRARLPEGAGVWPAFWTLGTNRTVRGWPACGEIDIMEFIGRQPDRIHANVHFGPSPAHRRSKSGQWRTERPFADFHIYAIEWHPDRIDFFFDRHLYHTFPLQEAGAGADNPFRKPHYLLVNLALGGSWGGEIDDSVLPQRYLVDYIRVYEAVPPPALPSGK